MLTIVTSLSLPTLMPGRASPQQSAYYLPDTVTSTLKIFVNLQGPDKSLVHE
jgi:hypothetical protein